MPCDIQADLSPAERSSRHYEGLCRGGLPPHAAEANRESEDGEGGYGGHCHVQPHVEHSAPLQPTDLETTQGLFGVDEYLVEHLSADKVIICETPRLCFLKRPLWVPEKLSSHMSFKFQFLTSVLPAVIVASYQLKVLHHVHILLVVAPWDTAIP